MSVVRDVDRFQRRHPVVGFPLAVIYKYFEDQGPFLAAIISFYAFVAIFPLMLISTSILGFILQDDPGLRDRLLDTALNQFPIVGDQLQSREGLRGSASAIVIGALAATYGSLNLGQAAQNAAHITWAVPRNSRTNALLQRVRSLVLLSFAGLGILALALASSLLANPDAIGVDAGDLGGVIRVVGFVVTSVIFVGLFRLVSGGRASTRSVLPGAMTVSVLWQLLQLVGNSFVTNVIGAAEQQMNQTFALVLGLVAFLYLAGLMIVLGFEINVVLRRRLYPRALLTPFTDNVSPTEADLKAYTQYAKSQRHKGFQSIESTFEKRPKDPPR
jgi:YihY family inner membrane protein